MLFELTKKTLDSLSASEIIVFAFENKKTFSPSIVLDLLDRKLDGMLNQILVDEKFDGKQGSQIIIHTQKKILSTKVVVLGLGKKEDVTSLILKKAFVKIAKQKRKNVSSFALSLLDKSETKISLQEQLKAISLGSLLGNYRFSQYIKKKEDEKNLETIIISLSQEASQAELTKTILQAQSLFDAIKLARDLVNEQAAVATPIHLGKIATEIAKKDSLLSCKIYTKEQIEKMGMGAFLAVARGSVDTPPVFIHLQYAPKGYRGRQKLAVVGKGITFDTGGVSLKPSQYMTTMKCDMAGAAAVLGLFSIISSLSPKIPVMGLIAATPNLISATAMVPGDIVRAMNGKTIEILNTDAEGRVTLADSLSYALKNGASEIVDMATLTGACEVALGLEYSAMYSNNKNLSDRLRKAIKRSGEKVWDMPLVEEYKELNKSDVADIANVSSSPLGGSITGALFLEEFIDKKPWAHFDIAGPAFSEKDNDLGPKGGTGYGVETLVELVLSYA